MDIKNGDVQLNVSIFFYFLCLVVFNLLRLVP